MTMPDFNRFLVDMVQFKIKEMVRDQEYIIGRHKRFYAVRRDAINMGLAVESAPSAAASAVGAVAQAAAKTAVIGATVAGHSVSTSPLAWSVKPMKAAFEVAKIAFDLEHLYALTEWKYANKYHVTDHYQCTCHKRKMAAQVWWHTDNRATYWSFPRPENAPSCAEITKYIVEQKEWKAIKIAVCSSVAGIPFYLAATGANNLYKRMKGTLHKEREMFATSLIRSALPALDSRYEVLEPGCQLAQAMVAMLAGELTMSNPSNSPSAYPKTTNAMLHPTGYEIIFKAMSR